MSQSTPTLSDIAAKAGVAKSTVSMALKNHPRISMEQCKRIQAIAREMGYQQNALLGQLMNELRRSRKQKYRASLAFVNSSLDANVRKSVHLVHDWLHGAEQRATEVGYSLDYFWLHEPGMTPKRLADIFYTRNIQGVAFYALDQETNLQSWSPIWEQFATVTVGARSRNPSLHFVSNDQYSTAYQACDKLWSLGYKRIGTFIDTWLDDIIERRFVAGYLARQANVPNTPPVLYLTNNQGIRQLSDPENKKQFVTWYETHQPDGILCNSEFVFHWLKEMGLRIPEDVGVALLDLHKEKLGKVAGMEQNPAWTGVTAIDSLIGQIHSRDRGIPAFQKGTLVESVWNDGPTVVSRTNNS